jgi:hypothetical protein
MPVPNSITINACEVKVCFVKHLLRDYERYGEYSTTEMVINLDADMSEQMTELIFCHELIEAIKSIYLLDIVESDIQPMAVALYGLIKSKQVVF